MRGDLQPLLAPGKAFENNGHSVCMVAGSNFRQLIEGHGLKAAASHVDIQAIMNGQQDGLVNCIQPELFDKVRVIPDRFHQRVHHRVEIHRIPMDLSRSITDRIRMDNW